MLPSTKLRSGTINLVTIFGTTKIACRSNFGEIMYTISMFLESYRDRMCLKYFIQRTLRLTFLGNCEILFCSIFKFYEIDC